MIVFCCVLPASNKARDDDVMMCARHRRVYGRSSTMHRYRAVCQHARQFWLLVYCWLQARRWSKVMPRSVAWSWFTFRHSSIVCWSGGDMGLWSFISRLPPPKKTVKTFPNFESWTGWNGLILHILNLNFKDFTRHIRLDRPLQSAVLWFSQKPFTFIIIIIIIIITDLLWRCSTGAQQCLAKCA